MTDKTVHTTPSGDVFKYEELETFSFKVVRVIADYLPPHIEEGIYVLTGDGELLGVDGTNDPPEPFTAIDEAIGAGRDFA